MAVGRKGFAGGEGNGGGEARSTRATGSSGPRAKIEGARCRRWWHDAVGAVKVVGPSLTSLELTKNRDVVGGAQPRNPGTSGWGKLREGRGRDEENDAHPGLPFIGAGEG